MERKSTSRARSAGLLFLAAGGWGCGIGAPGGASGPLPVEPGESFVLGVGQSARVVGTGPEIRFDSVSEDSRCPSDATCVWTGNARVWLGVGTERLDLNTGVEPRRRAAAGWTVELLSLEPLPTVESPVPSLRYRAGLRVAPAP